MINKTDLDAATARVLTVIRATGSEGILRSQITIRTPRIDGQKREEILAALVHRGDIHMQEERRLGGRPGTRYFASETNAGA